MINITAPAKLNLFLHITGRRDDGYHLLESLFAFTQFSDEITIESADALSLIIDGPYAHQLAHDAIEKNLVYRAARLLQNKYHVTKNVVIRITKNIPIGAGLGGGSSDAASVLNALNDFWELNLDKKALAELGLTLGADVPACIYQKTAMISGIGEKINQADIKLPQFILLINPNQLLSTKQVFQQYQQLRKSYSASISFDINTFDDLAKTRNDLTESAISLMPPIKNILDKLSTQSSCLLARMSGSGPTCFGLFENESAARKAEESMKVSFADYFVKLTQL